MNFEVEHLTEHDPSTRECTMHVVFASGEVKEGTTTISGIREGPTHFDTGYPASDPVEDASIECRPYTETPSQSEDCPSLLSAKGSQAEREARRTAEEWAARHKPGLKKTDFSIEVAKAMGGTKGPCRKAPGGVTSWRRTWVANVYWEYPKGSGLEQSASMASSTIFLGRTSSGWKVYYRFH